MPQSIFIFNPDTDYALAQGCSHYNAPAKIIALRKQMQLTPVYIAEKGDIIVVADDFSSEAYPDKNAVHRLESAGIEAVTLTELQNLLKNVSHHEFRILPWGWNHSLRSRLEAFSIDPALLKTKEEIDMIRSLAHRRTTIPFLLFIRKMLPAVSVAVAEEFTEVDKALEFAQREKRVYFKAPWSSSGRGILYYDASLYEDKRMSTQKLKEWLGGFIRKQGSVMGERAFNRVADFATEWWIEDGKAEFLGLSLFNTSEEGRYTGNMQLSQTEIDSRLQSLSPHWSPDIVAAQKAALESLIAPHYSGPAGIDMLIDADGTLNPCVEINLRLTMGMIALGKPLPCKKPLS